MQIITDYKNCPEELKGSYIALGNFDGVHKGHREIIMRAVDEAKKNGGISAVMTFEPHPRRFFQEKCAPFRITPLEIKAQLIEKMGVDALFVVGFTKKFSQINAEEFIEEVLYKALNVKHISIGYDFTFGNKKAGDFALLKKKAKQFGYGVEQMQAIKSNDIICASTKIREYLRSGDVEKITEIAGRNFAISGKVIKGHARGRTIGFPTANISLGDFIHPAFGVYAVNVQMGGENYPAVANIGVKPTFEGADAALLEVYIFDFKCDIYDKELRVELVKYIRAERKFANIDELKEQIEKDCKAAKACLDVINN